MKEDACPGFLPVSACSCLLLLLPRLLGAPRGLWSTACCLALAQLQSARSEAGAEHPSGACGGA